MSHNRILKTLLLAAAALAVASTPGFAIEYNLRAAAVNKPMPDGAMIPMWGFAQDSAAGALDGTVTVPGPTLTVLPGDSSLTIHLDNDLTVPISIVINGQMATMVPVTFTDGQGRQRIRSFTHETAPSAVGVYTWTNVQPGSYMYQSGTHPAVQVQMGLYGAVIKNAPDLVYGGTFTQAYPNVVYEDSATLFYSEIDPALHQAVATNDYGPGLGTTSTIDYEPKYFLVNGQPFSGSSAPIPAGSSGGGTLLRLFNAGLQTRSIVLQGSYMSLVAEDGQPYKYPKERYAALLPAGKTLDAMVAFPAEGTYPTYDRRLALTNADATNGGMLAKLTVTAGDAWPAINSVTATPASIVDTQTSQLQVNATGATTYSWSVPASLPPSVLSNAAIANPVFTPLYVTGPQTYTFTVIVSDGTHIDIGAVDVTVSPTTEVIVDNADPGTSTVGAWSLSTLLPAQRWGPNYAFRTADTGSFTFTATLPADTWRVYGWWTSANNRRTAVDYQIYDGVAPLDTVTVNQEINGGQWNLLGEYSFAGGAPSVTILAGGGGVTIADAVRFERVGPAPLAAAAVPARPEVLVDNLSPEASSTGAWSLSTALADQRWGANYAWSKSSGASFSFAPALVPGTTYQVYGWWTASSNRYNAVPCEIRNGTTLLDTVTVNQQAGGGQWNLLGTYTFTDAASVTIQVTPGSLVTVADAVKFVPVP